MNDKGKFLGSLKQSLIAYAFNIFGVAAGTVIASQIGLFEAAPWAILLYPPVISARGVIGGLFCGRLSTALHLGTMEPRFFRNTRSFNLLFQAIVVLTLGASVAMSLVAVVFGSVFFGAVALDYVGIFSVIMATMALAIVIISPVTLMVSFLSFRHGLDPDIVLYPVESTVSDLLITTAYIVVVNLYVLLGAGGQYLVVSIGLLLLFVSVYLLRKNMRQAEFTKTIKESLMTLVFVAFIVNVTGSTLGRISEIVGGRREVYTVYPALIDTMGDVGSVVGSTATTKLALGTLRSSFSSIKDHSVEIFGAWGASLIMYFTYSVLSLLIQGVFAFPRLLRFTALLFTANVVAASVIILISYAVAVLTFQRGLDPDNFVIPIESSLADSVTTFSLLLALGLFG